MTDTQDESGRIATALTELEGLGMAEITELARSIDRASRATVRAVLRIWMESEGGRQRNAGRLLSELNDLSTLPLLEIADPEEPLRCVWRLRQLTSTQLFLRAAVFDVLADSLEDERLVPYPPPAGHAPEERERSERVCDVAYKLLRELFHIDQTTSGRVFSEDVFDRMGFEQRDREIEAFMKTRAWSNLDGEIERGEDEGEDEGEDQGT